MKVPSRLLTHSLWWDHGGQLGDHGGLPLDFAGRRRVLRCSRLETAGEVWLVGSALRLEVLGSEMPPSPPLHHPEGPTWMVPTLLE